MPSFKPKYVDPIDKFSFRTHAISSMAFQLVFILLVSLLMHFFDFQSFKILTFILLICAHGVLMFFFFDVKKYRARFKDIYPSHNLSPLYFIMLALFPLAFLAFTLFLCLKNSVKGEHPHKIFKFRFAVPSLLAVFALQALSPLATYWTASPSSYHLVGIAYDSIDLLKFKDRFLASQDPIGELHKRHHGKLSSTQLIVYTAIMAQSIRIKNKKARSLASISQKHEINYKNAVELLEICHKNILIGENTKLEFLDYSPLQWFHPSGLIEIFLLSIVDDEILLKFNSELLEKSHNILDSLEGKIKSLEASKRDAYIQKISDLRKKFSQTKTYKISKLN